MTSSKSPVAKRSVGFLLGISSLMLGANLVWISYNTVLLSSLVEKVVSGSRGLVAGLLGFFGSLLAILVSILWGIISDHSTSKMGKRSPSILAGAVLALPFIALPALFLAPALSGTLLPIALAIIVTSYMGMQFFTNVSNGAWWPLLVDVVPEHQRGLTSGITGAFTLLGGVISFLLVTSLNQAGHTGAALWLIGGVFALTGVINTLVLRGKDQPAAASQRISLHQAMADIFRVRTRVAVFFWLVLALLLANMGFNSLQFSARYFFEVYFPSIDPDAGLRAMGGIILVVTMLAAVGSGFLSDKYGRRAMIKWSLFVCAICTLLMGFTGSFVLFLVFAGLRSVAIGPIMASAPALASDLSPKDEAGQYMAYNNLSTGLSGALSGLISGVLLVSLTRTAFMYLFIISAILFLLGGIVFSIKVPQEDIDARLEAATEDTVELA